MARNEERPQRDSFDSAWKHLLEEMLPEFLWFYFPEVADAIDWTTHPDGEPPWRFLNQELQRIQAEAEVGDRSVDRLVEARARCGTLRLLYIHIEVQSQPNPLFAERMFTYFYRLYDRFRCPVTNLAVLADNNRSWRPDSFELRAPGTRYTLRWPIVKLLDYQDREDELAASDNPFAWVTLAHLAAQQTRINLDHRTRAKRRLMRLAVSHGWERKRIIGLLKALDFMMRLPAEVNNALWQELERGRDAVEQLCDWEIGFIEKGREEGRLAEAALVHRQLTRRFGPLPDDISHKVNAGSFEDLDRWGSRLLDVDTLDQVFAAD